VEQKKDNYSTKGAGPQVGPAPFVLSLREKLKGCPRGQPTSVDWIQPNRYNKSMQEYQKKAPLPLWTVTKAWWSDTAAQECRALNWSFILTIFITSTIAISLPFAANRWRDAEIASKTRQYPGLGNAFEAMATSGFVFSIDSGKVTAGNSTPPLVLTVGDWDVIVTTQEDTPKTQKAPATAGPGSGNGRNLLQIGPDRFLVRNGKTGIQVSAPLKVFEGFSSDVLTQAAQNRKTLTDLIEGLLFTAAFSSIPSVIISLFLLMFVQNLAFVAILGVMLSFAVYRKKLGDDPGPALKPQEGIKMAAAIMAGPAFVVGLAGLFIPALKAPLLWLAYSFLAGIRVVILYTSRYRSAGHQGQYDSPIS